VGSRNLLKPYARDNNVFIEGEWFYGVIGHDSILEQLCDNPRSNALWRVLTEKTLKTKRITTEFDWSKSLCDEANVNAVKQAQMFIQRISGEDEEDNPENALEGALKLNPPLAEQKTNLAKMLLRILFPSPLISERIDKVGTVTATTRECCRCIQFCLF
jgi:hypothetical protein